MALGNGKNYRPHWKNKLYLLIGIVILIFFVINFVRAWSQNSKVNNEISGLRQEIVSLEQENSKYAELIKYFNSNAYIEERARIDLGLKKTGEKVVLIPSVDQAAPPAENSSAETQASNPQKWLKRFFK